MCRAYCHSYYSFNFEHQEGKLASFPWPTVPNQMCYLHNPNRSSMHFISSSHFNKTAVARLHLPIAQAVFKINLIRVFIIYVTSQLQFNIHCKTKASLRTNLSFIMGEEYSIFDNYLKRFCCLNLNFYISSEIK